MTRLLILSFALFLYGFGPVERCQLPKAHERFEGVVSRVVDGDTVVLRTASCRALHIRLMDFNAPEKRQPGYARATAELTRIALGQHVRCEVRKGRSGYSSYGRAHAVCRTGEGALGDLMRRAGIAEGGN